MLFLYENKGKTGYAGGFGTFMENALEKSVFFLGLQKTYTYAIMKTPSGLIVDRAENDAKISREPQRDVRSAQGLIQRIRQFIYIRCIRA